MIKNDLLQKDVGVGIGQKGVGLGLGLGGYGYGLGAGLGYGFGARRLFGGCHSLLNVSSSVTRVAIIRPLIRRIFPWFC